jgi:hypothetical protein
MQDISPRLQARIGGLCYLAIIVLGYFAEAYVRGKFIVSGNPAATAHNVLASESLYRAGGAAEVLTMFFDITVALILYNLLKPVNRPLALLAAFFRLAFAAVLAVVALTHFAPLLLLKGGNYMSVLSTEQLQALSLFSLRLHTVGFNISLTFFGVHCMLVGGLIAASNFLPRLIGGLLVIAGLCYLIDAFTFLVSPPLAARLGDYILLPGFVAEVALALWLSIIGLNVPRWEALAVRTRQA